MSQTPTQNQSILDAVHHEVGSASSPLLDFLTNNARLIAGIIITFVILIACYWGYETYLDKERGKWQQQFGEIVTTKNGDERITTLQEYINKSPKEFHANAYFAIVQTALELNNNELVISTWDAIGKLDASLHLDSTMGKANTLAKIGKYDESINVIQGKIDALLPKKAEEEAMHSLAYLYGRLGAIAEIAHNLPIALEAYQKLLTFPEGQAQTTILSYKINDLQAALPK